MVKIFLEVVYWRRSWFSNLFVLKFGTSDSEMGIVDK